MSKDFDEGPRNSLYPFYHQIYDWGVLILSPEEYTISSSGKWNSRRFQ
jgi:hypothetical protein